MTREEAIKIINCYDIGFYDLSGEKIPADKLVEAFDMAIEALQAEPVKHGEWKVIIKTEDEMQARCSECKMVYFLGMGRNPNYCPNCGAKMDKD